VTETMNQDTFSPTPPMAADGASQPTSPAGSATDFETIKQSASERITSERDKMVEGLRSFSSELRSMQTNSPSSGLASTLVTQAADRADQFISYVQDRDPQDLLEDARGYARSHPGVFLFGTAIAGGVLGRATRTAAAAATQSASEGASSQPTSMSGTTTGYGATEERTVDVR